jgi:hypothetical protein
MPQDFINSLVIGDLTDMTSEIIFLFQDLFLPSNNIVLSLLFNFCKLIFPKDFKRFY